MTMMEAVLVMMMVGLDVTVENLDGGIGRVTVYNGDAMTEIILDGDKVLRMETYNMGALL